VGWVGEREHVPHAQPNEVTATPYYPSTRSCARSGPAISIPFSGLDRRIGWVLRAAGRPARGDTVVIFRGQRPAGNRRHPLVLRQRVRVPLIIKWPKNLPHPAIQARRGHDQVISLLDITATTLPSRRGASAVDAEPQLPRLSYRPAATLCFRRRDRIWIAFSGFVRARRAYHYIRKFHAGPTSPRSTAPKRSAS